MWCGWAWYGGWVSRGPAIKQQGPQRMMPHCMRQIADDGNDVSPPPRSFTYFFACVARLIPKQASQEGRTWRASDDGRRVREALGDALVALACDGFRRVELQCSVPVPPEMKRAKQNEESPVLIGIDWFQGHIFTCIYTYSLPALASPQNHPSVSAAARPHSPSAVPALSA